MAPSLDNGTGPCSGGIRGCGCGMRDCDRPCASNPVAWSATELEKANKIDFWAPRFLEKECVFVSSPPSLCPFFRSERANTTAHARAHARAHTHTARHESTPSPSRHPTPPHHTTPHRTAPHHTTPHQARSQGALRHTPFSSPVALSLSARSSAAPGFPCLPVDRSGRTTTQVHIPRTGGTSVEVSCYGMPPPPARLSAALRPLREYAHATAPAILTAVPSPVASLPTMQLHATFHGDRTEGAAWRRVLRPARQVFHRPLPLHTPGQVPPTDLALIRRVAHLSAVALHDSLCNEPA
jgi:hypothetical protein